MLSPIFPFNLSNIATYTFIYLAYKKMFLWRYDILHNDIQHNSIQHYNKKFDTQHTDIPHNDKVLSCRVSLCWVSLCWVSLCWVSLYRMSLCWMSLCLMSWHQGKTACFQTLIYSSGHHILLITCITYIETSPITCYFFAISNCFETAPMGECVFNVYTI